MFHPAAPLLVSLFVGILGYAIVALIQLPNATDTLAQDTAADEHRATEARRP